MYGELKEELYLEQPEGFVVPGRENDVCRLQKSLYGLKQAPRAWNNKFNEFLVKFGLSRCSSDHCVYYRRQEEEITFVLIFVDDGLVCSNRADTLTDILEHLKTFFEVRFFPANRFLGLDINRDREKRQLHLSQPDFISKILERFNMQTCHPKGTPAARRSNLMQPADLVADHQNTSPVPYREAIGSLIYVMTMTRPDIAFSVSQASQFCENPGKGHWNGVKRILAYLAGTSHFGLLFDGNKEEKLIGYSDSDFAGNVDNRRSVSGLLFMLCGSSISWASRLQRCVSLSTTEAEFIAACESTKEAVWLRSLLSEILGVSNGSTPLLCDNEGAICLVKNPEFHQRTKHIDIKYHFIREKHQDKEIEIVYTSTENQLADLFTKPLPTPRFNQLRKQIGVQPL